MSDPNVYIGVDGKAKKVTAMHIGIDNKAKKVIAGWIGNSENKARLFFGGDLMVKRVFRGTTGIAASSTTATASIASSSNPVDVSKAVCIYHGSYLGASYTAYATLTNGTTVTVYKGQTGSGTENPVAWEVVEFY